MRRWMVLPLLVLVLGFDSAHAAKIGVYFDEAGQTTRLQVDPGRPFQFYVSVSDIAGGIHAFECLVVVDPRITVTGRTLLGPNPINVGEDDNWIVGLGGVVPVTGTVPVIDYGAILLASEEGLWIALEAAQNLEMPTRPRYLVNGQNAPIYEFDEVTGAVLNTEQGSWGDLKEQYQTQ